MVRCEPDIQSIATSFKGLLASYSPLDKTYKENLGRCPRVFTYVIIIKQTTLFQEDNIFGMNASLTYGPQLQRLTWH